MPKIVLYWFQLMVFICCGPWRQAPKDFSVLNIADKLNIICEGVVFTQKIPGATPICELKQTVSGLVVSGEGSEMTPRDLNVFLTNCGAQHIGVYDDLSKEVLFRLKPKPATVLNLDFDEKIFMNKFVVLFGGCFNGIHKGHFCALKRIKNLIKMSSEAVLVVLLASDAEVNKKLEQKVEAKKINSSQACCQQQHNRARALRNIPGIDYIISIPNGFSGYLDLIEKLGVSAIAVCNDNLTTKKYCEQHQQALLEKGKVVFIWYFPKEYEAISSSALLATGKLKGSSGKDEIIPENLLSV